MEVTALARFPRRLMCAVIRATFRSTVLRHTLGLCSSTRSVLRDSDGNNKAAGSGGLRGCGA